MTLKVGDTIWRFDSNYRIYKKRNPGDKWSMSDGPIYAEHWRPTEITGETSRSWVTMYGKVAKKLEHPRRAGWAFTQQQVEDDIWVNQNITRLQRALSVCLHRHDSDARLKMEKLMDVIGFNPEEWA